jgi:transcription elongation factor Elf1
MDYNVDYIIRSLGLQNIEQDGRGYWNFRCPVCLDSAKSSTKKRCWILKSNKQTTVYCFNCLYSANFETFLKDYFPDAHSEYMSLIFFKTKKIPERVYSKETKKIEDRVEKQNDIIYKELDMVKVIDLPTDHKAYKELIRRKIPKFFFDKLYYTNQFKKYVNNIIPDKFQSEKEEDCLVIPFFDNDGEIIAIQSRSLLKHPYLRYITIKLKESMPKVFGLDRLDKNSHIIVTEGAFDSMFLPNSLAMNGADLNFEFLESLTTKKKIVFLFDNEPRNKQICQRMEKVIDRGYKIIIFPDSLVYKDVNDMIVKGKMKRKEVLQLLKNYNYTGINARLRFNLWNKCSIKNNRFIKRKAYGKWTRT